MSAGRIPFSYLELGAKTETLMSPFRPSCWKGQLLKVRVGWCWAEREVTGEFVASDSFCGHAVLHDAPCCVEELVTACQVGKAVVGSRHHLYGDNASLCRKQQRRG